MSLPEQDKRLDDALEMIAQMAALDFSKRLPVEINPKDSVDAILYGLNMLSEELQNNITEKKRLEDLNKRLDHFAFVASHDLKSPLNSMQGLIVLIKEFGGKGLDPNLVHMLEMLDGLSVKMRTMVDGILGYAKLTNGAEGKEKLNVAKELADILDVFVGKQVLIRIDPGMPEIWYNRTAFIQIFQNLVSNAIKFNDKEMCMVRISCADHGKEYCFSVTDNGPGIEEKYQSKVFDLFVHLSLDKEKEGSGIGLATVKKLVDNAGGKIWIQSKPGEGCSFCLTIPKAS